MSGYRNVWIGIQARSTSERFPRKVFELIGNKPMLQHVIDAAEKCASYMNRYEHSNMANVQVAVLIPEGDEIKQTFGQRAMLIEGPENDVLTRYYRLAEEKGADYVVRITADCPLIPPYVISKTIKLALHNGYDYVSNVDEKYRTAPDGMDCEVISRQMLAYAHAKATAQSDREHVTTFIRREPPTWAKMGAVIGFLDLSGVKMSVDTVEDLERVRTMYNRLFRSLSLAETAYGRAHAHRF